MKKYSVCLLVFVCVAVVAKEALAAKHVVGGSQGWDASTDYNSWSSGEKFKVGDQLVFKYSSGLHSVVELGSETAYKKCDLGSAVNSMSTGNDAVKLDKAGTRYFTCGTLGHCGQGMKVKVTVEGSGGSAPSTPASSSSTSTSSSTASSASTVFPFGVFVLTLLVSALLATCLVM